MAIPVNLSATTTRRTDHIVTDAALSLLPQDADQALLVGRIWDPQIDGPRVIAVRGDAAYDLLPATGTVSELFERPDHLDTVRQAVTGNPTWRTADILEAAMQQDLTSPCLLAPVDLQVIKACGVTFVDSMIERVIEERIGGDPALAAQARALIVEALGSSISELRPGSAEAARAKVVLQQQGLWSQYLEVGIGPDPEIFTKAPVLASVGLGAEYRDPTCIHVEQPGARAGADRQLPRPYRRRNPRQRRQPA